MKKAFLFVVFATLLLSATKAQAQLGFHAGYAPQTFAVSGLTVNGTTTLPGLSHGFFAGVHYNRAIAKGMGFIAAAQIRMNSVTVNASEYTTQDWQFIADVPLLLNYGFAVTDRLTLGAFVGPMLSYGISYTQKTTDAETFEVITTTDRYGTSVPAYALKRFEAAAAGGIFLKFRSFVLYGGYRLGLNDIDRMSGSTTRARGFFVGIGVD